eukprot:scaffold38822_cov31-Tisochrysis_lutea.AAC.2
MRGVGAMRDAARCSPLRRSCGVAAALLTTWTRKEALVRGEMDEMTRCALLVLVPLPSLRQHCLWASRIADRRSVVIQSISITISH